MQDKIQLQFSKEKIFEELEDTLRDHYTNRFEYTLESLIQVAKDYLPIEGVKELFCLMHDIDYAEEIEAPEVTKEDNSNLANGQAIALGLEEEALSEIELIPFIPKFKTGDIFESNNTSAQYEIVDFDKDLQQYVLLSVDNPDGNFTTNEDKLIKHYSLVRKYEVGQYYKGKYAGIGKECMFRIEQIDSDNMIHAIIYQKDESNQIVFFECSMNRKAVDDYQVTTEDEFNALVNLCIAGTISEED